jgi:arsenate reductase
MFSNTFAGIAPASVPGFILGELVGCALAVLAVRTLYPDVTPAEASRIVVPQVEEHTAPDRAASQPMSG